MDNSNLIKSSIISRYIDIKELSIYTSLPTKTLYEWSSVGKIPSIKIGRRVLFDLHDIDKVMAGLKRNYNQCENIANKIVGDINGDGV